MKSFNFSAIPFVRLLIPLLVGRVLSLYIQVSLALYVSVFLSSLLAVVFLSHSSVVRYSRRWLVGVAVLLILCGLGVVNSPNYTFDKSLWHKKRVYSGVVREIIKEGHDRQSLLLTCSPVDTITQNYFKALLYLQLDSGYQGVLPGDIVAFEASLSEWKSTGNPFAFEYGIYMQSRGVVGQFFMHDKRMLRLGKVFSVSRLFYQVRRYAEEKLKTLELNEAEFGIVSALVLGDKSMLDYETKANFSNAGAIHILSVSGLHVGIIYLMIMAVLGGIGKGMISVLKVVVILGVLWFYAAIAGMSPSVSRATVMFSVFVISKWISHRYDIYHSMAIAAFIILILNPYTVFHAGFWLSFFAVASIVYFYPKIYGWLYFSSPWAQYLWALFSVSLAAQIGTLPLSVYLFGFFPTWFLITNFLLIPILPFILVGAVLVVVLPFNFIIVQLIAAPTAVLIRYLMQISEWVGGLPYAAFVGLQLKFYQVVILYLALVFFVLWQHLKRGKYLVYVLLFLFVGMVTITASSYVKLHQQFAVVHQVKGKTAISITKNGVSTCWVNEPLDAKEISYAIWPLALNQEATDFKQHVIDSTAVWPLAISKYNIIVVNGMLEIEELLKKVDVIVFTGMLKTYQISKMLQQVDRQTLVFDSSFSASRCRYIQKELEKYQLKAHFVTFEGAYVLSIKD